MRTLVLNIPDTVDLNDREALMAIASRLYETGRLSMGQAAELVGLSKRSFMELLGSYGVSVFNYPPSDLDRELTGLSALRSAIDEGLNSGISERSVTGILKAKEAELKKDGRI